MKRRRQANHFCRIAINYFYLYKSEVLKTYGSTSSHRVIRLTTHSAFKKCISGRKSRSRNNVFHRSEHVNSYSQGDWPLDHVSGWDCHGVDPRQYFGDRLAIIEWWSEVLSCGAISKIYFWATLPPLTSAFVVRMVDPVTIRSFSVTPFNSEQKMNGFCLSRFYTIKEPSMRMWTNTVKDKITTLHSHIPTWPLKIYWLIIRMI